MKTSALSGSKWICFFQVQGSVPAGWVRQSLREKKSAMNYVAGMAFGKPTEPLYRELSQFKRKALAEISKGKDERLEAARIAPSAVNSQNWYFVADNGKIHCYRKKSNPLLGFIYNKLHCIDMGIALLHIAKESKSFQFVKEPNVPERDGHIYMGTVCS